jgi:Fe-S-cluster containining protein
VRKEYLKRVGLRTTVIEHPGTKDCIFLNHGLHGLRGLHGSQKRCIIYPVRPGQCRTWPFWSDNLTNPNAWNKAAQKCPGINQGRLYTCDEIEKIKRNKKWWQDAEQTNGSSEK